MKVQKIYLIAKVNPERNPKNAEIVGQLDKNHFVCMLPQDLVSVINKYDDYSQGAYEECLGCMKAAHLGLAIFPVGRDCSWEIGWFCGTPKPVIGYCASPEDAIDLNDWMIKGGIHYIIAKDEATKEALSKDATLVDRILVESDYKSLTQCLTHALKRYHHRK